MSFGAKKAPIDTRAADAMTAAGENDRAWMQGQFGTLYDIFRGTKENLKDYEQSRFRERLEENNAAMDLSEKAAPGIAERARSRAGFARMTPEQAAEAARLGAFSRVATRAGVNNTSRRGFRDWSVQNASQGAAAGAGFKAAGFDMLSTAVQMEQARNAANANMVKGGAAGAIGGLLTGAMSGGATAGPIGALAMGGLGAVQGYN